MDRTHRKPQRSALYEAARALAGVARPRAGGGRNRAAALSLGPHPTRCANRRALRRWPPPARGNLRQLPAAHSLAAPHVGVELGRIPEPAALRRRDRAAVAHRVDGSEEHTSELQSLIRLSYAVFCLNNKMVEHT